ncbi:MAG: sensor histidine kinase, partial [Maribacter sp.]
MHKIHYILIILLIGSFTCHSQVQDPNVKLQIKGTVKGMENGTPISGVGVSTNSGEYTLTNAFGEFKIRASMGEELIFESPQFETVRHRIRSGEDVDVKVRGYPEKGESSFGSNKSSRNEVSMHALFLDSANYYKKTNIERSIDFITKSIADLGQRADKRELAQSLSTLGEVYYFHKQYDLSIASFLDALEAQNSTKTSFLLGKAYVANGDFKNAEQTLTPLLKVRNMVPFQKVELYEYLGDA